MDSQEKKKKSKNLSCHACQYRTGAGHHLDVSTPNKVGSNQQHNCLFSSFAKLFLWEPLMLFLLLTLVRGSSVGKCFQAWVVTGTKPGEMLASHCSPTPFFSAVRQRGPYCPALLRSPSFERVPPGCCHLCRGQREGCRKQLSQLLGRK